MRRTAAAFGMLAALVGIIGLEPALALNCSPTTGYAALQIVAMESTLNGNAACHPASGPPWTNQEYHRSSASTAGAIIDHKKGPSSPKDSTATVGGYSIATEPNAAIITYTYGSTQYQYTLRGTLASGVGPYDLCASGSPAALVGQVKVIAGSGSCG
jgi:hypothetical protein